MCKWMKKHVDKFKKRASAKLLFLFGMGKFLSGLGIGILLLTYWPSVSWNPWGWGLLAIGILLGLYGMSIVCRK